MNVTVRPADPDDAEAIHALGRAAWHAAYDDVFGPDRVDRVVDQWWGVESLRGAAVAEERAFLVATDAGAVVGVADAGPEPGERGTYHLGRLYVHPGRWGEGVGGRLVDHLRGRLPVRAERLRLVVLAENPVGVSFYESYGFERVDERAGETDGVEHREYVYELSLGPQD
ncbi:GNAT family N-acetyltransferase [Salinirubellus salinus]|uniref:GNAT family N-acetyltransferase n=1 Tax=Salinirubellus salinus TaxID=1364945 RepID=A0A9E7R684_9EURY|nr:GNAT family N-acetyltransferase [Salinirubellus salinus]UWM55463.1 GNAT family N-acetyltransferase [Salinirubellus salinus]